MNIAIRCESLSKLYRIGQPDSYKTLRDVIADAAAAPFLRMGRAFSKNGKGNPKSEIANPKSNAIWALKDVSFEVRPGEVVGIIGRNGAGKSTLLRILSRITKPTEGHAEINGRVGSLLEVGTGFHPELSGRENIYLNGAILGMRKTEIERKFDEIVAFAEVEQFIDTPVKRYSSGMYVRLAFAVAAHMETEILLVDEVLAVGDVAFQKKCLGKMEEASKVGRTVLFVSHQIPAVQNLCNTGILLANGQVDRAGNIHEVISRYLNESSQARDLSLDNRTDRKGSGALTFRGVVLRDRDLNEVSTFVCGAPAIVELSVGNAAQKDLRNVRIGLGIDNDLGQRIVVFSTHLAERDFPQLGANVDRVYLRVPQLTLLAGRYNYTLFCSVNGEVSDWIDNAGSFDVAGSDFFGSGKMPGAGRGWGTVVMEHQFRLAPTSEIGNKASC